MLEPIHLCNKQCEVGQELGAGWVECRDAAFMLGTFSDFSLFIGLGGSSRLLLSRRFSMYPLQRNTGELSSSIQTPDMYWPFQEWHETLGAEFWVDDNASG